MQLFPILTCKCTYTYLPNDRVECEGEGQLDMVIAKHIGGLGVCQPIDVGGGAIVMTALIECSIFLARIHLNNDWEVNLILK